MKFSAFPATGAELDNNRLSGAIPTWLGELVTLQTLSLANNTFSQLGQLTGRVSGYGSLRNAFPTELGMLTQLQILELSATGINGTIPTEIFNLGKNLKALLLGENALTGTIPSLFGDLNSLSKFSVPRADLYLFPCSPIGNSFS